MADQKQGKLNVTELCGISMTDYLYSTVIEGTLKSQGSVTRGDGHVVLVSVH